MVLRKEEMRRLRSDPDQWTKGWSPNTRGVSYVFGADVVTEICQKLDLDLIARAHQVVQVNSAESRVFA